MARYVCFKDGEELAEASNIALEEEFQPCMIEPGVHEIPLKALRLHIDRGGEDGVVVILAAEAANSLYCRNAEFVSKQRRELSNLSIALDIWLAVDGEEIVVETMATTVATQSAAT